MCIRDRAKQILLVSLPLVLSNLLQVLFKDVYKRQYHDSGMLFRLPNGLAVEPVLIRKKFLKWQDAHPEFPRIVFHGLRHSSATYQLMISGGDVKAVPVSYTHLDVYKRQVVRCLWPLHWIRPGQAQRLQTSSLVLWARIPLPTS